MRTSRVVRGTRHIGRCPRRVVAGRRRRRRSSSSTCTTVCVRRRAVVSISRPRVYGLKAARCKPENNWPVERLSRRRFRLFFPANRRRNGTKLTEIKKLKKKCKVVDSVRRFSTRSLDCRRFCGQAKCT